MNRALILLVALPLAGCGAARSVYYLWDAQKDLVGAQEAQAPEKARYEYTLAHEYLMKAREEAGYSDYGAAESLARKSSDWSNKAAEVAQYGTSERELMLNEMDQVVPEEVEPPPDEPVEPIDDGPLDLDDDEP